MGEQSLIKASEEFQNLSECFSSTLNPEYPYNQNRRSEESSQVHIKKYLEKLSIEDSGETTKPTLEVVDLLEQLNAINMKGLQARKAELTHISQLITKAIEQLMKAKDDNNLALDEIDKCHSENLRMVCAVLELS